MLLLLRQNLVRLLLHDVHVAFINNSSVQDIVFSEGSVVQDIVRQLYNLLASGRIQKSGIQNATLHQLQAA